jgi:hypothetical protein
VVNAIAALQFEVHVSYKFVPALGTGLHGSCRSADGQVLASRIQSPLTSCDIRDG